MYLASYGLTQGVAECLGKVCRSLGPSRYIFRVRMRDVYSSEDSHLCVCVVLIFSSLPFNCSIGSLFSVAVAKKRASLPFLFLCCIYIACALLSLTMPSSVASKRVEESTPPSPSAVSSTSATILQPVYTTTKRVVTEGERKQ